MLMISIPQRVVWLLHNHQPNLVYLYVSEAIADYIVASVSPQKRSVEVLVVSETLAILRLQKSRKLEFREGHTFASRLWLPGSSSRIWRRRSLDLKSEPSNFKDFQPLLETSEIRRFWFPMCSAVAQWDSCLRGISGQFNCRKVFEIHWQTWDSRHTYPSKKQHLSTFCIKCTHRCKRTSLCKYYTVQHRHGEVVNGDLTLPRKFDVSLIAPIIWGFLEFHFHRAFEFGFRRNLDYLDCVQVTALSLVTLEANSPEIHLLNCVQHKSHVHRSRTWMRCWVLNEF